MTAPPPTRKSLVRGLENQTESFHCFLNVILQALWCVDSVRDWFIDFVPTEATAQSPVLLAISSLFTNYEWAETPSLPPDEVRQALARLYKNLGRFQQDAMDDAVEVFEAILKELHGGHEIDEPCAKGMIQTSSKCLGHSVFAAELVECTICNRCGATSGVDATSNEFVQRLYASEVTRMVNTISNMSLGLAVRATRNPRFQDSVQCAMCKIDKSAHKQVMILQAPPALCISFVWTPQSTPAERFVVMKLLDPQYPLMLADAFDIPGHADATVTYRILGFVAFYGLHYVFFRNFDGYNWIQIDDSTITSVGDWKALDERCTRGQWKPVLAFFTRT